MNFHAHHTFYTGSKTVGTSAVQLSTSGFPVQRAVTVAPYSGNVGSIYVGPSGVMRSGDLCGFPMRNTLGGVTVPVDDLCKVWVISDSANNVVHWMIV